VRRAQGGGHDEYTAHCTLDGPAEATCSSATALLIYVIPPFFLTCRSTCSAAAKTRTSRKGQRIRIDAGISIANMAHTLIYRGGRKEVYTYISNEIDTGVGMRGMSG
jgi:hypothetical protein